MNVLRALLRLARLGSHLVTGALLAVLYLRGPDKPETRERRASIASWWLRKSALILGVRSVVHGAATHDGALIVANHISWLDILVLGGAAPVRFLSMAEVAHWPVIGFLTRSAGTLFIERGGRDAATVAAEQITRHLQRGEHIGIFPEGATSLGESVSRFHPRLFAAAIHSGVAVQPVAIRYVHTGNGTPTAPFVGEERFLQHVKRVLVERSIEVKVTFCEPLASTAVDRRQLADQARASISSILTSAQPSPTT